MAAVRVQISLSEETLAKLDNMAERSGLKRSAVLAMLINQAELLEDMTADQIVETIENNEKLQEVIRKLAQQ